MWYHDTTYGGSARLRRIAGVRRERLNVANRRRADVCGRLSWVDCAVCHEHGGQILSPTLWAAYLKASEEDLEFGTNPVSERGLGITAIAANSSSRLILHPIRVSRHIGEKIQSLCRNLSRIFRARRRRGPRRQRLFAYLTNDSPSRMLYAMQSSVLKLKRADKIRDNDRQCGPGHMENQRTWRTSCRIAAQVA